MSTGYYSTGSDPTWHCYITAVPPGNLASDNLVAIMDLYNPLPDLDAFCSRAVRAMAPSMGTGFSGANFLLELKELSGLWKWAKGHITSIFNPRYVHKPVREIFNDLSNEALNYSFGIKPLISDIESLYKGLTSFEERLSNLQKDVGKPQLRHYTEVLPGSACTIQQGAFKGVDKLFCTFDETRITATMKYVYTLPELSHLQMRVRAALDLLGLDVNLHVIWNAIPLSFVIDWAFNVSAFLEQFTTKWIEPILRIRSFGYSVKRGITVSQQYRRTPWSSGGVLYTPNSYPNFIGPGHRAKLTTYSRKLADPSPHWFSIENTGELTGRKIFLGALLMEQRLR